MESRALVLALGAFVALISAGTVNATTPAAAAEARVSVVPKMLRPTSPVAALAEPKLSMALPQMPESTPSPATTRGFSILVATALPESLRLPCESISSMMMITSPSPMPPPALQAQTPAPRMTAPRAARSKSRPKSKLVAHEPQAGLPWSGLSWWQSLLSIRIN